MARSSKRDMQDFWLSSLAQGLYVGAFHLLVSILVD